jgi:hypothetical protein
VKKPVNLFIIFLYLLSTTFAFSQTTRFFGVSFENSMVSVPYSVIGKLDGYEALDKCVDNFLKEYEKYLIRNKPSSFLELLILSSYFEENVANSNNREYCLYSAADDLGYKVFAVRKDSSFRSLIATKKTIESYCENSFVMDDTLFLMPIRFHSTESDSMYFQRINIESKGDKKLQIDSELCFKKGLKINQDFEGLSNQNKIRLSYFEDNLIFSKTNYLSIEEKVNFPVDTLLKTAIINNFRMNSEAETIAKSLSFCQSRIAYKKFEEDADAWQMPILTLWKRSGACGSKAFLLATIVSITTSKKCYLVLYKNSSGIIDHADFAFSDIEIKCRSDYDKLVFCSPSSPNAPVGKTFDDINSISSIIKVSVGH